MMGFLHVPTANCRTTVHITIYCHFQTFNVTFDSGRYVEVEETVVLLSYCLQTLINPIVSELPNDYLITATFSKQVEHN